MNNFKHENPKIFKIFESCASIDLNDNNKIENLMKLFNITQQEVIDIISNSKKIVNSNQ